MQMSQTGRFQEFVKGFGESNFEGPLVEPGLVGVTNVAIQLVSGALDVVQTPASVKRIKDELSNASVR